ncbi:gp6 domain containing protein [uncultured Caudovirales phage]|uniref:Gp6 domain containing protein n=1 Tax=uncultured Caudovirales phage TaxID=2100421 RepID=A0A6J5MYZ0_9CAUD|nr:gp6 domain containing protein [uncultured Caudovirales phage]
MATLLPYALTNLADVKETLDIPSSDHSKDNLIIRKINQATELIEKYCGRRFLLTSHVNEEFDGTGIHQLILKNRPVDNTTAPVENVTIQRRDSVSNEDEWSDIDTENFFIDKEAGLLNSISPFFGGYGRYRVSYRAGYATIPADLAEACVTLASYYVLNPTSATAIKRKKEGLREVEYFDPNNDSKSGGNSIIDQLGIDEILKSYSNMPIRS